MLLECRTVDTDYWLDAGHKVSARTNALLRSADDQITVRLEWFHPRMAFMPGETYEVTITKKE